MPFPGEPDYRPRVAVPSSTSFLPGTSIEIVRPPRRGEYRHVLFDFDGTLSLIREGWPEVMIPMMVEILADTPRAEDEETLTRVVTDFVMELNGKQTIYQMIRLAEEVKQRGGTAFDPAEYKAEYHNRLMARIAGRREAVRCGRLNPDELLVPYARQVLQALVNRGAVLHLASGTDEAYVREECELLRLTEFFGGNVHGAQQQYQRFSKAQVIAAILDTPGVSGEILLGFGDGYVEIGDVKSAGGTAVAVASDEKHRSGRVDPWKRERLIGVGADLVIPDFRHWEALLGYLWPTN